MAEVEKKEKEIIPNEEKKGEEIEGEASKEGAPNVQPENK